MKPSQKEKMKARKSVIAKVYAPKEWPYWGVVVRIGTINYELQSGGQMIKTETSKLPGGLKLIHTTMVKSNSPEEAMKASKEYLGRE